MFFVVSCNENSAVIRDEKGNYQEVTAEWLARLSIYEETHVYGFATHNGRVRLAPVAIGHGVSEQILQQSVADLSGLSDYLVGVDSGLGFACFQDGVSIYQAVKMDMESWAVFQGGSEMFTIAAFRLAEWVNSVHTGTEVYRPLTPTEVGHMRRCMLL